MQGGLAIIETMSYSRQDRFQPRQRESERVTLMDMILRSDYQACHDASQPHHHPLPPFPPDKYGDYDPSTRIPQLCVLHCLHRPRASGFLVRWEGEREAERGPRPMMIIPRRPAAAAGLPRATFPYYYGCCISYLRMQAWYCGRGGKEMPAWRGS